MVSFENIKISNKILGRGMNGTVYLVKDNKNKKICNEDTTNYAKRC